MNTVTNCLECGADIPADAKGLCPKCLLKLGLASQLSPGFIETGVQPPPFLRFDPSDPSKPGTLEPFEFGGYRILRLLGKGGMGAVYEAEDLASGRHVALKVLGHSLDSADTRKRFIREGRLAASINHPNSVYVYGTEEVEGAPVITMELVPGGTLHERVKAQGPLPVTEAVDAILQIVAGLEAAHVVGILHRDIKPSNCFLEPNGTVKIGDFGLSISTLARGDSAITLAGSFLGTPEFSSPEQLRGEELNVRSDIYSVGMTLYYLLVGKTPFRAENMVALLATVLDKAVPSPRIARPDIPEPLARLVLRCLAKQSGDRPATYDELRRALLPFTSTAPTPATLGLRFVAGAIDHMAITGMNMLIPLVAFGGLAAMANPASFRTPQWSWWTAGMLLFEIVYFSVPEGLWGASLGKAAMGLRVGGLNRNAPGIPRAALRAVIYMVPTILTYLLMPAGKNPMQVSAAAIGAGLFYYLYPILLCLSARRHNGFATVIDLLTKTRVIQRSAYEPRTAIAQIEEPVAATAALPKIGPYEILTTLDASAVDELVLGYDTRLLRRVWIRKLLVGAPAVAVGLRNAARPGRLRWLQGHRDDAGSWDAYEAVPGTPLVNLLHAPQPWKNVRHWLHDLAAEFDSATRDGSLPATLALDHVWITADGRAKLLDFSAPGADQPAEPVAEPAVFLNQVAISALEGRVVSADEAQSRSANVPVPIPARDVLRELRLTPDFTALAARFRPLTPLLPSISRRRRLGLIAGCMVPALVCGLFMFGGMQALQNWQRQNPAMQPLRIALAKHAAMSRGHFPEGVEPEVGLEPMEIYIAGHYGEFIRDRQAWSSPMTTSAILPVHRREAERMVAAHPNPTAAEMERARAALGSALDAEGNFRRGLGFDSTEFEPAQFIWIGMAGIYIWAAIFSLGAALLFRGGLLMRALGIAAVRRDGADASRWRMLWRACVAWSWVPLGGIAIALLVPLVGIAASIALVALLLVATVACSALLPERGLQDRLAGIWLVPR